MCESKTDNSTLCSFVIPAKEDFAHIDPAFRYTDAIENRESTVVETLSYLIALLTTTAVLNPIYVAPVTELGQLFLPLQCWKLLKAQGSDKLPTFILHPTSVVSSVAIL